MMTDTLAPVIEGPELEGIVESIISNFIYYKGRELQTTNYDFSDAPGDAAGTWLLPQL
jgi:hypothetical protein